MFISEFSNGRDNNFNLIRFIAAILVLYSHSYPLYGLKVMGPIEQFFGKSWGSLAVHTFFISSGFLIMGSFKKRVSSFGFIISRLLRIYPALIVAILFCVYIVGFFSTNIDSSIYLKDGSLWDFIKYNSLLVVGPIRYGLIGVFKENPYPNAVNGSLWTLPYEVKMYFYLYVSAISLAYLEKIIKKELTKVFYLISLLVILCVYFSKEYFGLTGLSINTLMLFIMFLAGVNIFNFKEKIKLDIKYVFLSICILMFYAITKNTIFQYAYIFLTPYLLFYTVYIPKGIIRQFNSIGDYSYGIYIYAFPIQQFVMWFFPDVTFSVFIIMSVFFTLLQAFLSWHLIEKRALKLKSKILNGKKFIFKVKPLKVI